MIRTLLPLILVLLVSGTAPANIVMEINMPGCEISGIATIPGYIWAMSRTPSQFYLIDSQTGSLLATYPYPTCEWAVGLAYADGVFYWADYQESILRSITLDGDILASWDLSTVNPGIQSICGVGYDAWPGSASDELLISDGVSKMIYLVGPLGQFTEATEWIDLSSLDTVGDVASNDTEGNEAVVCDSTGVLWFYTPSQGCYLSLDFSYLGVDNITCVAQDPEYRAPHEFSWVYDRTDLTIYLLYHGLPLERDTWGGLKPLF